MEHLGFMSLSEYLGPVSVEKGCNVWRHVNTVLKSFLNESFGSGQCFGPPTPPPHPHGFSWHPTRSTSAVKLALVLLSWPSDVPSYPSTTVSEQSPCPRSGYKNNLSFIKAMAAIGASSADGCHYDKGGNPVRWVCAAVLGTSLFFVSYNELSGALDIRWHHILIRVVSQIFILKLLNASAKLRSV